MVASPFDPASILISLASIDPVFETNLITPFSDTSPCAFASVILIVSSTKLCAASAFIVTIPFLVSIVPSFFASDLSLDGFTLTVSLLLPLILNKTSSPAARAVEAFAIICPLLLISGEINATYWASIFPLAVNFDNLSVENDKLSFKKFWFVIFNVDSIAPSALTAEVGPINIPVGFTNISLPFEKIDPLIIDFPLTTLFKIVDLLVGWLKYTDALDPTLNVFQFTMPCWVVWFTSSLPTLGWLISILPLTTWPPVGKANWSIFWAKT